MTDHGHTSTDEPTGEHDDGCPETRLAAAPPQPAPADVAPELVGRTGTH